MKSKTNKKYIFFSLFLITIIIFLTFYLSYIPVEKVPYAKKGFLDLSNWNFYNDGIVTLDGEWEFYWNELLTYDDFHKNQNNNKFKIYANIPSTWNKYKVDGKNLPAQGCGTYRLRVKTNDTDSLKGLKILTISTSYKLMINDKVIATNGIVNKNKDRSAAQYKPQAVIFRNNSKEFEIIIQVSNYIYSRSGFWHSIHLGTDNQIIGLRENSARREMFLLGIMITLILYHIPIYWLQRKNLSILYFLGLLIIITLRILFTGEYFITNIISNISVRWIVFVEYTTMYWGETMLILFISELYREEVSKKVTNIFLNISIIFTIFALSVSLNILTKYLIIYEATLIILFSFTLFLMFTAVLKKRDGAILLFSSMIIFLLIFINDVLYFWNKIDSKPGGLAGFNILILLFIQSYILAARYSKAFDKVENLSNKMISLNKLKDEFLANTSHELRTPLYGIISITESILQNDKEDISKKQRDNLSLVVTSAKRLANLVNNMLDYSKLKHNDIKLNKKTIDIQGIVQMVLDMYKCIAVEKSIRLENNIPENFCLIFADEEKVYQILYKLIGNAVKFTHQGKISVSATQKKTMFEITVEDTGIGIPQHKLENIFDSFEQVDSASIQNSKGTRLGLNITKQLVKIHGGKIKVVSDIEKGSKFTFTMPISRNRNFSADYKYSFNPITPYTNIPQYFSEIPSILHQNGEFTVLIVNDNYINLQYLINILSSENYSIITSSDSIQALDIISKDKQIDLVILDIIMPKISGLEICRRIREKVSLYELPVIMLTTQNDPKIIFTGLEAGANDFLCKPFYISELKARVNTLLQLKKSVQNALNAEMAFLQAQIKPHFLYNALNTIISFCWTDGEKAGELLSELSIYLRRSFDFNNKDKFIHINKELEYVQAYLSIEKARFENKLNCEFDLEEDKLDFMLPPFVLQPLVENAIKHGILPKENGGRIKISIKSKEKFIQIKVIDNGVGIPEKKLENLMNDTSSNKRVGIKNVNKRIEQNYGYGIQIKSILGKGTIVSLNIPYNRGDIID